MVFARDVSLRMDTAQTSAVTPPPPDQEIIDCSCSTPPSPVKSLGLVKIFFYDVEVGNKSVPMLSLQVTVRQN